jgi:hypothetical protein
MNYGAVYSAESDHRPMMNNKVKRPGLLARWVLKKLTQTNDWAMQQKQEHEVGVISKRQSIGLDRGSAQIDQPERALQFTVYVANGGRVVETRRYDKKTDRNTNGLYVINNDADFGKEIDKIITMESLRG